jgi:hypothetical protein
MNNVGKYPGILLLFLLVFIYFLNPVIVPPYVMFLLNKVKLLNIYHCVVSFTQKIPAKTSRESLVSDCPNEVR